MAPTTTKSLGRANTEINAKKGSSTQLPPTMRSNSPPPPFKKEFTPNVQKDFPALYNYAKKLDDDKKYNTDFPKLVNDLNILIALGTTDKDDGIKVVLDLLKADNDGTKLKETLQDTLIEELRANPEITETDTEKAETDKGKRIKNLIEKKKEKNPDFKAKLDKVKKATSLKEFVDKVKTEAEKAQKSTDIDSNPQADAANPQDAERADRASQIPPSLQKNPYLQAIHAQLAQLDEQKKMFKARKEYDKKNMSAMEDVRKLEEEKQKKAYENFTNQVDAPLKILKGLTEKGKELADQAKSGFQQIIDISKKQLAKSEQKEAQRNQQQQKQSQNGAF